MTRIFQRVQRELKSGNPRLPHKSSSASVDSEVESAVVPTDHCHTQPPPQASEGGEGPSGVLVESSPQPVGDSARTHGLHHWRGTLTLSSCLLPGPITCPATLAKLLMGPPEASGPRGREGPQHPRGQFGSCMGCHSPHLTLVCAHAQDVV